MVKDSNTIPVYLEVTLDRTLTYREHIRKTAGKLKTRNNLLSKLAGTRWGANASVLRSSALALCYSVAEYCAPVWCRSTHTAQIDADTCYRHVSGMSFYLSVRTSVCPSITLVDRALAAKDGVST